jgi:ABC-type multidrug transport system fused ATPase/permease subunit
VFINKFRYKHNVEAAKIDGELFGHINESIYALHTVNLYNKKDKTIDKFDLLNQRSNKLSIKSDFISAFGLFINNIFSYVIQLGVIIIGIFMVINGTNLSIIPSIILLSTYFNSPINQISDFFSNFSNFYSSANRLYNFLAIPEIKKQTGEEQKNLSYVGNIEFKNITFSYKKDVPVLENVNLSIPAGRKIAIVGETGSGKTTITSLLMRFYRVDKGEITIDGININDMTEDELYRYISIVQQEP